MKPEVKNKNGEYKVYYSDGKIKHIYTYDKTTNTTDAVSYNEYGNIIVRGTYINNKLTGSKRTYNKFEMIKSIDSFVDGAKNGVCIEYFVLEDDDGKFLRDDEGNTIESVRVEYSYRDGMLNGICKLYRRGKLAKEETYANGHRDGLYKLYSRNGELTEIGNYFNGDYNGLRRTYFAGGNLKGEKAYSNGQMNGSYKCWYNNGLLEKSYRFIDDERDGHFEEYYPNGQIKFEGRYEDDYEEGVHRNWYEDGTMEYEVSYIRGREQGTSRMWFENGQIKEEGDHERGVRVGSHKKWDKDGKLLSDLFWDGSGTAPKEVPANISKDDYILWNSLADEPFENYDVVYHYTSLAELFDNGTNDHLPPFVEVKMLIDLSLEWQEKISDAIQLTK